MRGFRRSIVLALTLAAASAAAAPDPAAGLGPSSSMRADDGLEGFSRTRLDRLDAFLAHATSDDGYVGAVALIARNGTIVESRAFGHRDLARRDALKTDSIFRIYSMTKTIATVAVLQLMEQGKLTIDEPVAKYLPDFANLKVFAGGRADAPVLRAPLRPLTIHHLLTHTAGFATSGDAAEAEVHALLDRADLSSSKDLKQFVERVARVPLAADPGTRFKYDGVQIEVASRIVEVVSGETFDAYLKRHVLDPLGMRDTTFSVPPDQRDRIVDITTMGDDGRLRIADGDAARHPGAPQHAYPSGAGGLYSTAGDYYRFAEMLREGGTLDGVTILGRKTVDFMMANHLTMLDPPVDEFSPAEGFGLGGYVVLDVAGKGRLGSVGQYGWSGAASTYYTIDRHEGLVAILMLQHLPREDMRDLPRISANFYNLVYQALVR